MNNFFVISTEDLNTLIADAVERAINSAFTTYDNKQKNKPQKKSKMEETSEELDNWIYWEVALKRMGISKQQWWTKYQKLITHRSYSGTTWIYLPSILKFFEDGKVN